MPYSVQIRGETCLIRALNDIGPRIAKQMTRELETIMSKNTRRFWRVTIDEKQEGPTSTGSIVGVITKSDEVAHAARLAMGLHKRHEASSHAGARVGSVTRIEKVEYETMHKTDYSHQLLAPRKRSRKIRITVEGPQGAGKTRIMNFLEQLLEVMESHLRAEIGPIEIVAKQKEWS